MRTIMNKVPQLAVFCHDIFMQTSPPLALTIETRKVDLSFSRLGKAAIPSGSILLVLTI